MAWPSTSTIKTVTSPRNSANKVRFSTRSVVVVILCATLVVLIDIGSSLPAEELVLIPGGSTTTSSSVSTDNATRNKRNVTIGTTARAALETPPKSTEPAAAVAQEKHENPYAAADSDIDLPPPPVHPQLSGNASFVSLPPSERALTPLRDHDRDQFTIRILSWNRAPFLAASVAHHSQCPGVQEIQVVWSVLQEDDDPTHTDNVIPEEVLNNPKVSLERRDTNELTNRFDIQNPSKTLAILSLDDDVLYPCDVLDMGFFLWTQNPERLVTYFPRKHTVDKKTGKWKYSYWKGKEYSLGLTGTAFVHRDYLYFYTHFLPRPIYSYVQENMNCEDVAMSLFVSKLTGGKRPLAVDKFAMHSRVQLALRTGYSGIKNSGGHMKSRNGCVESFANQLQVKEELGTDYSPGVLISAADYTVDNPRHRALEEERKKWVQMPHSDLKTIYHGKRKKLEKYAISRGLSHQGSG